MGYIYNIILFKKKRGKKLRIKKIVTIQVFQKKLYRSKKNIYDKTLSFKFAI